MDGQARHLRYCKKAMAKKEIPAAESVFYFLVNADGGFAPITSESNEDSLLDRPSGAYPLARFEN